MLGSMFDIMLFSRESFLILPSSVLLLLLNLLSGCGDRSGLLSVNLRLSIISRLLCYTLFLATFRNLEGAP